MQAYVYKSYTYIYIYTVYAVYTVYTVFLRAFWVFSKTRLPRLWVHAAHKALNLEN